MLAEFSVIPIGSGESMGDHIATVLKIVDASGLPYRANAMSTVIEGDWDKVMAVIRKCQDEVLSVAPRVMTSIHLDIRPGKPQNRITEKLKSVEKRLGKEVRK